MNMRVGAYFTFCLSKDCGVLVQITHNRDSHDIILKSRKPVIEYLLKANFLKLLIYCISDNVMHCTNSALLQYIGRLDTATIYRVHPFLS